jgi:lathosterol oxidase
MPLFIIALDGHLGLFYGFLLAFIGAYVIVAGVSFMFLYLVRPASVAHLKIQQQMPSRKEVLHEIGWSSLTLLVWAVMAVILIYFIDRGLTQMYSGIESLGVTYFVFSILFLVISHDAYFYWVHRLMHDSDFAYKYIHSIHHESKNPTPFAIFSFGPIEAVLMGLYVYLIVFLVPINIYALAALFVFDTTANLFGHMGYELIPKKVTKSRIGRMFNTSVIHDLHHSGQQYNYSLYFRFWDKFMKTANQDNEKVWEEFHARNEK